MTPESPTPPALDESEALRRILEVTASETGEEFFSSLVRALAELLDVSGAWVTEYLEDEGRLRALAFWLDGEWVDEYEYDVAGTPCEPVVGGRFVHVPDRVVELYPDDPDLSPLSAVSYMGLPFTDTNGRVLGHLAVLDTKPLPEEPRGIALFRVFADRAAAEVRRLRAEAAAGRRREEAEYLRAEVEGIAGVDDFVAASRPMRRVVRDIEQVGPTDTTVLILGETGTGKELVARALHAAGSRAERPLIKVNCAAIPEALIESELFGHEKGAFTGATERREGRFQLAHRGTIFLDEVGELPLALQPKLLRVLQEGAFEPVGSDRTRAVDVRVVAATNRDLEAEVAAGRFRGDLYYRLAVFPITLPPLRERGEDVGLLARHFVERIARRLGRSAPRLGADDERRLHAYDWPGNVRELQNAIERALVASRSDGLDLDRALPGAGSPAQVAEDAHQDNSGAEPAILTDAELRALERDNLVRALVACDWTIAGERGAAARLGLPPSTLASRMKSLGIRRSTEPQTSP